MVVCLEHHHPIRALGALPFLTLERQQHVWHDAGLRLVAGEWGGLLPHPGGRRLQFQFTGDRYHDLELLLHTGVGTVAWHLLLARAGLQLLWRRSVVVYLELHHPVHALGSLSFFAFQRQQHV